MLSEQLQAGCSMTEADVPDFWRSPSYRRCFAHKKTRCDRYSHTAL